MSNASSLLSARPELAGRLAEITPLTLARDRILPVAEHLHPLIGAPGLQRGASVAVHGASGALSLSFALMAEATRQGSWVAVVGGSWLGLGAIGELGVPLERLVLVENIDPSVWPSVVAALLDGFDLVVCLHANRVGARDSRQLIARNRERGGVLVRVGGSAWADAADLRFDVAPHQWGGIGTGYGHVDKRLVSVITSGRRGANRQRRRAVWLPDGDGICRLAHPHELAEPAPQRVAAQAAVPAQGAYAGADIDRLVDTEPAVSAMADADVAVGDINPRRAG